MEQTLNRENIRLLVVDDHPVVRSGLTSMLGTQADIRVIGTASSGEEALRLIRGEKVDLALLDLRMPGISGLETLSAIKMERLPTRVIILTCHETDEDIYRAIQAGADGYLLKKASLREMVEAIRTVKAGKRYVPSSIASRLAGRMLRSNLSPRETEILKLVAKGLTNKQIGVSISISDNTARNHVNSIIQKLQVADRTEAATVAIHRGLIDH